MIRLIFFFILFTSISVASVLDISISETIKIRGTTNGITTNLNLESVNGTISISNNAENTTISDIEFVLEDSADRFTGSDPFVHDQNNVFVVNTDTDFYLIHTNELGPDTSTTINYSASSGSLILPVNVSYLEGTNPIETIPSNMATNIDLLLNFTNKGDANITSLTITLTELGGGTTSWYDTPDRTTQITFPYDVISIIGQISPNQMKNITLYGTTTEDVSTTSQIDWQRLDIHFTTNMLSSGFLVKGQVNSTGPASVDVGKFHSPTTYDQDDWGTDIKFKNLAKDPITYNVTSLKIWVGDIISGDPNDIAQINAQTLEKTYILNQNVPQNKELLPDGTIGTGLSLTPDRWVIENWTEDLSQNRGDTPLFWGKATYHLSDYDLTNKSHTPQQNYSVTMQIYVLKGYYVRANKAITQVSANKYQINISTMNLGNEDTPPLYVYDIIPSGFNLVADSMSVQGSLESSETQDGNVFTGRKSVSGLWEGVAYWWYFSPLSPQETVNITYMVLGQGSYKSRDLYILGLDPINVEGAEVITGAYLASSVKKTSNLESLFILLSLILIFFGFLKRRY